jgi:uncharacterized membrane protein YphA (DoxX/SURF4 family)
MSGLLRSRWLHLVLRLLLGGYFLYACIDKISQPAAFARIVYQWQVSGPVASNLVAVLLPWVELLAAVLLILGVWKREAALVIALLLCIFLGAATSVLARGIDVENCGCTSLAKTEATTSGWPPAWTKGVGWFLMTRNTLLLGTALLLAGVEPRRRETTGETPAAPSTAV